MGLPIFTKTICLTFIPKTKRWLTKPYKAAHDVFSALKVFYDKYPDHIGRKETNGCFRCHNNTKVSDKWRVISKDCNICHTNLAQVPMNKLEKTAGTNTLLFNHPIDKEDA